VPYAGWTCNITILALTAGLCPAILPAVTPYGSMEEAPRPIQEVSNQGANGVTLEGLLVSKRTSEEIAGSFNHASSSVTFSSRFTNSSTVLLRLQVNDLVLDGSADLEKGTRVLDGHGDALDIEARTALVALSRVLEQEFDLYRQDLPAHEEFLVRVGLFWSEAPVGWAFDRQEVTAPRN
jgi:hypothetical protein